MAESSARDHAGYLAVLGTGLVTLGGIFIAIGAATGQPLRLWGSVWLDLAIVLASLGALALVVSAVFFWLRKPQPPNEPDAWKSLNPVGRATEERREATKSQGGGTETRWEETRRGQDAAAAPKTVEARAHIPKPSVIATSRLQFAQDGTGLPISIYADGVPVGDMYVVRARVKNDPPGHAQDADVTDAVVALGYFPVGENTAEKECDGRWTDNPYPELGQSRDAVLRRRLPATGEWQDIDVALKHKGEPHFYAGSNDLAIRPFGWKHEQYKLSGRSYRVLVTIRGHGLASPVTHWYRLENPPGDDTLRLTGELA